MWIPIDGLATHLAFLSKWHVITATLMKASYGHGIVSSDDPRNNNIRSALDALNAVLLPFVDKNVDGDQRLRNLEEIMKRAAGFAFLLFSQPNFWRFEWQDDDGDQPGNLVVFPALLQISDDAGEILSRPRVLGEKELVKVA